MARYIIIAFFSLSWNAGICQNLDSLYQVNEPIYRMPFDTTRVHQLITNQFDSTILELDTIISDIHCIKRIEYLGAFQTSLKESYKLVRYVTEERGKHWGGLLLYHRILVFDEFDNLIGYYELRHNYFLIELNHGVLKCSPEPGNFDCYPSPPGTTDLKLKFPINMTPCGCHAHQGNDDIDPIYFIGL